MREIHKEDKETEYPEDLKVNRSLLGNNLKGLDRRGFIKLAAAAGGGLFVVDHFARYLNLNQPMVEAGSASAAGELIDLGEEYEVLDNSMRDMSMEAARSFLDGWRENVEIDIGIYHQGKGKLVKGACVNVYKQDKNGEEDKQIILQSSERVKVTGLNLDDPHHRVTFQLPQSGVRWQYVDREPDLFDPKDSPGETNSTYIVTILARPTIGYPVYDRNLDNNT